MRSQLLAFGALGVLAALTVSCKYEEKKPTPAGNPDAGEGARAKKEEGKVGKKEAKIERIGGLIGGTGEGLELGGLGTRGMGSGAGYGSGLGSEQYVDYGVSDFFAPQSDRVSTFSVDVDTGAYTISRRKLREGTLPPAAAVRVEEFVNYFDYAYAPPADDALFRVHTEVAPHPYAAGHHLLRVALKGRELPESKRPPVHLTFLVDTSGSMAGPDRLPLARRALHYLVDNLGEEDTVAIATYAGSTRRVLEPTPTTRAGLIHDAIDTLSSGGGTAMESGMDLAYEMAKKAFLPGAENRVVVLSDGDTNIGRTTHTEILDTIAQHAGQGITLSTVGFGTGNYKDALMEQLADKGDGNYSYIDSMEEAKKVFGTDLTGTLRTIARDVKVQVEFDPAAVHGYRLIGYENRDIADQDFRNDQVDAGEVGSGHQVTALYDLVLVDGATAPIATVRLRAKPPGADAPAREWSVPVAGPVLASFEAASPQTRLAFGVASFAELLRGSPHMAEVRYDQVLDIVRGALDPEREDQRELLSLIERARLLSSQAPVATSR